MPQVYFQGKFIDVPDDPAPAPIPKASPVPVITTEALLDWVCVQIKRDPIEATLEILTGMAIKP